MKRIGKLTVLLMAALAVSMLVSAAVSAVELSDIKGHWAKEYIEYGVEAGYISGYSDGTFKPDKTVTRAEFSKMLNNAVKLTSAGDAKGDFTDVNAKEWYFEEVKKAEYAGYITGYEDGSFRPGNPITRQEAAVILSRIVLPVEARVGLDTFADGETVDSWAEDSVSMIAAKGYIKGDEKGRFLPKGSLTRSQAAKLICEFVKNENIVNKDQMFVAEENEIVFSETLFTDSITIDASENEEVNVVFRNCRIMGTVTIASEGVTVDFEGSYAKKLSVEAEGSAVVLDLDSKVKTAEVAYPVTLSGNGFENVVLDGDELSSDTVVLSGTFADVEVYSDALISGNTVENLDVEKKVNLVIQSGTVKALNVKSGAKNSTINLSKNALVKKASNKAVVTYIGTGTIELADNSVEGVVYDDDLEVVETTGKGAEKDDKDDKKEETEKSDVFEIDNIIFSPTKSKTNVAVSSNITITFSEKVYDDDGEELTADYVEDNFELRRSSSSGTVTSFKATVTSSKRILINPDSNLKNGTKYYLVIPAGVLMDKDDNENEKIASYYFTTAAADDDEDEDEDDGSTTSVSITFDPESGDDAPVDTEIEITFSSKIYRTSSKGALTEAYCQNTAFQIREGTSSGDEIDFTASVSSTGKTVTLTPDEALEPDTKYYVIVVGGKLYDSDGDSISKKTSYFTTDNGLSMTITPENAATGVSNTPEIVISFKEPVLTYAGKTLTDSYVEDEVVEIRKGSSSTSTKVSFTAEVSANSRYITIYPDEVLAASGKYYITVNEETLLGKDTEAENEKVTSYFTVATAKTPIVYPASGTNGVSVDKSVTVTFGDGLYTSSNASKREEVTPEYIIDEEAITLRRKTVTGKIIDCDITVEDGVVTLDPKDELEMDTRYWVVVKASKLYNESKSAYTAVSTSFDTTGEFIPEFSPEDGDEDIDVDSSIKITYDDAVFTSTGSSKVTKTYVVENVVKLYKGTAATGTEVDFSAEVSSDRKVITITPDDDLDSDSLYTVVVVGESLTNNLDEFNNGCSISFTTESVIDKTVTITPKNASTNVSTLVNPVVTFESPIFKKGGGNVSASYAAENIVLTEGTKKADLSNAVPATVEISDDGKEFTIIPDDALSAKTKYYVYVISGKFVYSDEKTAVAAKSGYFTTIAEMPALSDVEYTDVEETTAVIKYTSNCSGKVYAVIDGKTVASKTQSSKGNGSLTINGLEGATSYEVVVYIVSNDIYSEEYELNFTTLTPEEEEACEICGSAAHTTDECTKIDCELCGRVHEPEDKWCDSCSDHSHNEDEHCEVCGEYHETEPDKTCTVCENHEHNDEDHCGECGEVGGHTDECSENQLAAEE